MSDSEKDVNESPHFTFIWTIENMCLPCDSKNPIYTVKEIERTKWNIEINDSTSEFVELWVSKCDGGLNGIEIKCELSFLDVNGLPLNKNVFIKEFSNTDPIYFNEFVKREVFLQRKGEFCPEDALTIRCRMWRTGTDISQKDLCFARTILRPNRRVFIWTIRKFSTLEILEKKNIKVNTTSTNQLTFTLFLSKPSDEEYLNIMIQNSEWKAVKICLLDFEGKVVHSVRVFRHIGMNGCWDFFKKVKLMDDKESLLPNDVLSLRCEIQMKPETVWNVIENYRYFTSMNSGVTATKAGEILRCVQDETSTVSSSFTKAMKILIEEGTLSDVSLRTDSKSFAAHKCILSARSPVFKAMFRRDTKERTSKCVEIPDFDEDTLEELLSYIYTDMVGELQWRRAIDLYRAGSKYELLDLKRRCADFLKSDLSVSNVCAILSFADLHHDRELREVAQDFVMQLGGEFFTSDTWRSFKEENSKLAWEIAELILCNRQ